MSVHLIFDQTVDTLHNFMNTFMGMEIYVFGVNTKYKLVRGTHIFLNEGRRKMKTKKIKKIIKQL